MEILTRGPVHEAFAATINFKAVEGLTAPKGPPESIQEMPPEQRPEGDNVTWIPGYWAWDDETNGFLWVSGIWRNLPPGRQWIPGYWWESGQGHQWISGYWADAQTDEVEYLSEPPASLEAGPNVAAPSRNHTWIPGSWRWRNADYAWQPGYWNEVQPDWVWVPPYYSRAPQGWLYVDGYYDYDVPRRGLVFAPVRFASGYYPRPDYYYRPSTVISLAVFTNHLFLRPRNHHYYFGDYYAPRYRQSGYYASSNYYSGGYGYDPIYAHQRWTHRDDDRWERRAEENFAFYRDNESARPPHTLAAMTAFLAQPDRNRRMEADYATRLDQLADRGDAPVRLRKLGEAEQKNFAQRGREIRDFGNQRRSDGGREANPALAEKRSKEDPGKRNPQAGKSVRAKMAKSPAMAQAVAGGENLPPARPNASGAGEKSTGKNERSPNPEIPQERADNKGKGTSRDKPVPDSSADTSDPRRGGRAQEAKEMPKVDRKDPPVKDMPRIDPKDPVRKMPKPESRSPGNPEAGPDRGSPAKPQVKSQRQSEAPASPKRETAAKGDKAPKDEPRRAVPPPVRKAEPSRAPRTETPREPKGEPKTAPQTESKRKSDTGTRQEPPSPEKKEPKAQQPREPKAPSAAPEAPGKKGAPKNPEGKAGTEKENKKGGKD